MPHLSPLSWGFMGILGAGSCMMMHYFNWWRPMLSFYDKGHGVGAVIENGWGWFQGGRSWKAKDCKSFYD